MKLNYIFSFLIISLIFGCTENKLTSHEIVANSIKFHDPNGEWWKFNKKLYFESSFSFNDSVPEELIVDIDVLNNNFTYKNLDRGVEIIFNKDSCYIVHGEVECDWYRWTKNFYTYVWGLPMKLNDDTSRIQKQYIVEEFDSRDCYTIDVHYESENYSFFISTDDFSLRGFVFKKNDDSGKKELVYLSTPEQVGSLYLPTVRQWSDLKSDSLIGTNRLVKSQDL